MNKNIAAFLTALACAPAPALAQEKRDAPNCTDYPSFTRLQGYYIEGCTLKAQNDYTFSAGRSYNKVEGKYWYIRYQPPAGTKSTTAEVLASASAIVRKAGAQVVDASSNKETLTLTSGGKETWIEVWADHTGKYILTIVERPATGPGPAPLAKEQPKAAPPPASTPATQSAATTPVPSKRVTTGALSLVGTQDWSAQATTPMLSLVGTQTWSAVVNTDQLTLVGTEF